MEILEKKIPPPALAALFALLLWAIAAFTPAVQLAPWVRWSVPIALLVSGLFFCSSGVIAFRNAQTTVNPLQPEQASTLVSDGIYGVSRNPMYVGLTLILTAWAIYLAAPWAFLGVAAFALYLHRFQILPEERALEQVFGADYEAYRARVRRWL